MPDRLPRKSLLLLVSLPLGAALVLAMTLPVQHDYRLYSGLWWRMRHGGDPWLSDDGQFQANAYGPIFNLFAWPYGLHPLLPRALFVVAYGAGAAALLLRFGTDRRRLGALAVVLFGNALLWVNA